MATILYGDFIEGGHRKRRKPKLKKELKIEIPAKSFIDVKKLAAHDKD